MLAAITPLMIGFFSGFHCIAMCGGLCAVLCQKQTQHQVFITNLGRITTYTLLGALFAGLIQSASLRLDLATWGYFLRLLMGVMLVLTGFILIFKEHARWLVIQKPLPFWSKVAAHLKKIQQANSTMAVYYKGMLWGMIPCGLLYGMLIIAATTADVIRGASFMLFFGIGTLLPLMLSQTVIRKMLVTGSNLWLRRVSGFLIILLGTWIVVGPWLAHWLLIDDNVFFTELDAVLDMCIP